MKYDLFALCVLWFFAYFTPRIIYATFSKDNSICQPLEVLCEGKAPSLKCIGFENFQIDTYWFLECQFLEKHKVFHFGQFLMHQRKFHGILQ